MPIWIDTGIHLENVVQLLGGQLSHHPPWLNLPHHILVHPHEPFQAPGWWWWASRNSAQGASSSAGFQRRTAGPPMSSGGIEETVKKRTPRCPLGPSCYTPESRKNNRGWGMRTGSSVLPRTYTLPRLPWPTSLHRWGELEEVQLWWGLAETRGMARCRPSCHKSFSKLDIIHCED